MRKLAIPLVLVLIAVAVLFLTRSSGEIAVPPPGPGQNEEALPEKPTEVVLSDGVQLRIYDLDTEQLTDGAKMPTSDFDISLDGMRWAATDGKPDTRNPDPAVEPTAILTGEVTGDEQVEVGIGYS